jgi:DNA-binding transcriptional regulator YhcF (GntR family)
MSPARDRRSPEQLAHVFRERLLNQLHLGVVSPGDRLPSVRHMAREFGADPKVVHQVYHVLSGEGLVEVRPRSGVFVAKPAAFATQGSGRDWLVDALIEARRRGISPRKAIEVAARATTSTPLRALVIDRNRDQLWSIAEELRSDYGFATECLDLGDRPHEENVATVEKALHEVDLVLTTAFERRAVRMLSSGSRVPVCAVTMCSELFAEVRRLLATQRVYFLVADSRFGAKLLTLFSSMGASNLRVLVHGEDDLEVPSSAPVYITRLTRTLLAGENRYRPLLERGMPEARVFSEDTARDLVRFLVKRGRTVLTPSQ